MEKLTEREIREYYKKNEALLDTYFSLASKGMLSHAYIIEGASYRERGMFAYCLAAKLLCLNENSAAPCFSCSACAGVFGGTFPDMKAVCAEGATLSVNEIRNVRTEAFYKPEFAHCKVFIIEDAEKMNSAAQNALLKILEEPPKDVYFFLISSSKNVFLPTIISRTQAITLKRADTEFAKAELSRFIPDETERERVANVYMMLEKLEINKKNTEKIQNGLKICEKLLISSEKYILEDFPKGNENRDTVALYLDLLMICAKEILVQKISGASYGTILCKKEELSAVAQRFSAKKANYYCEIFANAKERISENANINTVITYLFTELTATDY